MSGSSEDHDADLCERVDALRYQCVCDACGQPFEPTESMSVEHLTGSRPGDDESLIFLRCWGCARNTVVCAGGEA